MNIFDRISTIENEITRKITILELDSRFSELVEMLNEKLTKIRKEFVKIEKKTKFEAQKFFTHLNVFLKDDIESVMKIYNRHKNDQLSIYDDSSQEINDAIILKETELEQFIEHVALENYDASLSSYLRIKYQLIKQEYQKKLIEALKHKEAALKFSITNTSPKVPVLVIYGDCELVKKIYLNDITRFLENYLKDFNNFIENKKTIKEKELLIESTIKNLKMGKLLPTFLEKKQNYQESISEIASIHMAIAGCVPIFGPIQNAYIKELEQFYSEILGENIDIYHQIEKIHQEISEIIAELEKNELLKDIVELLKQKRDNIEQTFIEKEDKNNLEWQKYLVDLTLYLEENVKKILNIHNQHIRSDISIYDDSEPEIHDAVKELEQKVEKMIAELEKEYSNSPIFNYLKQKYKQFSKKYYTELEKIICNNKKAIENKLLIKSTTYELAIYPDCQTLKKQFIEDLTIFLELNLEKISELEQINKQINELVTSLEARIQVINNEELLTKLNVIKVWFNEYLETNTNKTLVISELQIIYLNKLMELEKQIIDEEKVKHFESLAPNYFNYLTNTDIKQISFSKLMEIFKYLKENINTELSELLMNICYQIIKYETLYQKKQSYLYEKLDKRTKLKIEQLFLEDIKQNKNHLQENGCLEMFLTTEFSLELLTNFVEITMVNDSYEFIQEHQQELIDNLHQQKSFCIEYLTNEKMKFDENGECLVKNEENEYFIINRNGIVTKVIFYHPKEGKIYHYAPREKFDKITYHNGILKYNYKGNICRYQGDPRDYPPIYIPYSGCIIADSKQMNNDCGGFLSYCNYKTDNWKHYNGLIYYYVNGKIIIETLTGEEKKCIFITHCDQEEEHDVYSVDELTVRYSTAPYIKGLSHPYYLKVSSGKKDTNKYQYIDERGKCHFCVRSDKKPKVIAQETSAWTGVHCLSFENGYTILYDQNIHKRNDHEWCEAIILDHKFQKSFGGILGSPCFLINDIKRSIRYFISKKDKKAYILENGNLIQMSVEEIYNHYLVERYVIAKNDQYDSVVMKKDDYYFDSLFDILTNIHSQKQINNQKLIGTSKKI